MKNQNENVKQGNKSNKLTSELIDLKYIVKFDDGLKNRVVIYGIDPKTNKVYYGLIHLGVNIKTGIKVVKENGMPLRMLCSSIETNIITDSYEEGKFKEGVDVNALEKEIKKRCIEEKVNVINIKNKEHIQPAIDRYAQLYMNQFEQLAGLYNKLFEDFIKNNRGYFGPEPKLTTLKKEKSKEKKH